MTGKEAGLVRGYDTPQLYREDTLMRLIALETQITDCRREMQQAKVTPAPSERRKASSGEMLLDNQKYRVIRDCCLFGCARCKAAANGRPIRIVHREGLSKEEAERAMLAWMKYKPTIEPMPGD